MPRKVREGWRHKALKAKAKTWLSAKGYNPIAEVTINHSIIDVVGFKNGSPTLGIECGSLNRPLADYAELPITILHMALRGGMYPEDYPHRFGGCPYCNALVARIYGIE